MTSDQERLNGYVAAWRSAVDDVLSLLRSLDDEDWARPTDLPGWTVKDVAAHLAHLESELAGVEQEQVELPDLGGQAAPTAHYTELGVVARERRSGSELTDELERCAASRQRQLLADPPRDGKDSPPRTPGNIGWDWETLLSNRVLDVWMHDQDIRRAVGRPGDMTGPGAEHTVATLTMTFPYVVGKRVAPPTGSTVVLDVTGVSPVHLAVSIDQSGRAVPTTTPPVEPTVAVSMDMETFVVLAGGRRPPQDLAVDVRGDQDLGRRLLEVMAVTP